MDNGSYLNKSWWYSICCALAILVQQYNSIKNRTDKKYYHLHILECMTPPNVERIPECLCFQALKWLWNWVTLGPLYLERLESQDCTPTAVLCRAVSVLSTRTDLEKCIKGKAFSGDLTEKILTSRCFCSCSNCFCPNHMDTIQNAK